MGTEISALLRPAPEAANENDYRSFCDALSASARGRAFLAEYARRNRHADTETLLAALDRLEARLRTDGIALERLRDELRLLLIGIRLARPEIDAASPLTKAAKLASLLALMERRIDAMVDAGPGEIKSAGLNLGELTPPPLSADEPERPPFSVVPQAEEPELPIPAPANTQRAIALVQAPAKSEPSVAPDQTPPDQAVDPRSAAVMPEVSFAGGAPPVRVTIEIDTLASFALYKPAAQAAANETPAASAVEAPAAEADAIVIEIPPAAQANAAEASAAIALEAPAPTPAAPPADRMTELKAIMALSDDERMALFT